MGMKPIDLQSAVPKSPEVGRVAKVQQQEGQSRLSSAAAAFKAEVERSQRQVEGAPKSEGSRIDRDSGRERGGRSKGGGGSSPDEEGRGTGAGPESAGPRDPHKGGIIDIVI